MLPGRSIPVRCIFTVCLVFLMFAQVNAQDSQISNKSLKAGHLSLEYPENLTVTDASTDEIVDLTFELENHNVMIVISSPRFEIENPEEFLAMNGSQLINQYADSIIEFLVKSDPDTEIFKVCQDFRERKILGYQFRGSLKGKPALGTIFSFMAENRTVNYLYLRSEEDKEIGNRAHESIISSLKLNEKADSDSVFDFNVENRKTGDLSQLVAPQISRMAITNQVFGSVKVKALINEEGKAIYVKAFQGPALYYADVETAVKLSLYKPRESCGIKIKFVTEYTYNFPNSEI